MGKKGKKEKKKPKTLGDENMSVLISVRFYVILSFAKTVAFMCD